LITYFLLIDCIILINEVIVLQVVVIMAALMLLINEESVIPHLGQKMDRLPLMLNNIWMFIRKAIDLNMSSPGYIVRRMQAVRQSTSASSDRLYYKLQALSYTQASYVRVPWRS
jgi:hypothetical protein